MMCAIEAGKRGRSVAVLEHADRVGRKILISGGGRCNFTNLHCRAENFLSSNPHFVKSALSCYRPSDFIALVEKHGIAYHEKTLGQLFCDGSAREIVSLLECELREVGGRAFLKTSIGEITRDTEFSVHTDSSEFRAPTLVIATGGLSIPKMGATDFGYKVARKFGLAICTPRPALVPLTFGQADAERYADLAGVSAEVVAMFGGAKFREKMLFTHRGLSGPVILQISSYWKSGESIALDLAPETAAVDPLLQPKATRNVPALRSALRSVLPQRLADRWLDLNPPQNWTNRALEEMERRLHRWEIEPAGTEGYEKAEVTAGGVDTNELQARTMESRKVPGLFFIGEVVDVTGQLGGFNFQWAWASGYCAGQAV